MRKRKVNSQVMQYLSLEKLKKLLNLSDENELTSVAQNYLNQASGIDLVAARNLMGDNNLTEAELKFHMELLAKDEGMVFHQWIVQHPHLTHLLEAGQLETNDFRASLQSHFLFEPFIRFVSPFICQELFQKLKGTSPVPALESASYIPLMLEKDQDLIQGMLQAYFEQEWKNLQLKLGAIRQEKELVRELAAYFSAEHIATLNLFTKRFYASKIECIDQALALFKHPACTYRVAYWLIGQLRKLQLNTEHQERIEEVYTSLRTGDGKYLKAQGLLQRTHSSKQVWKRLLWVLPVGVLTYWLCVTIPEWIAEEPPIGSASSFEQFNLEERQRLDSLIRTMEVQQIKEEEFKNDNAATYLHVTPVNIPIVDRDSYENQKLNTFVDDALKAVALVEKAAVDRCMAYTDQQVKNVKFPGFSNLSQHKGEQEIYLRNATGEQLVLLLFDNTTGGSVYAQVLRPAEEVTFKATHGQRVLLLPGKDLGSLQFNQQAQDKPSSAYQHHFCQTDSYFESQLRGAYQVQLTATKQARVLANRSGQGEFYLIDLDEVFEM